MTPTTTILVALIALAGTVVTVIGGLLLAKMLRPNELIDQLQEERTRTADRLFGLESRERLRDDYILTLRQHINDGNPPPPPPWPAGLTLTLGVVT